MKSFSTLLVLLILSFFEISFQLSETELNSVKSQLKPTNGNDQACIWNASYRFIKDMNTCGNCNPKLFCQATNQSMDSCGNNRSKIYPILLGILNSLQKFITDYEDVKIAIRYGIIGKCNSFG